MMVSSHKIASRRTAEEVTLQRFANCYLREIDPGLGVRHPAEGGKSVDCLEWRIANQQAALRIEILSTSLVGPHLFGRLWMRRSSETVWRQTEPFSGLYALLREGYRHVAGTRDVELRHCELELLLRVLQSYQSTALYLEAQAADEPEAENFIAGEQSLVFGHWLHPTPKSLQGMANWQQPTYAPEMHGRFRLHAFAAAEPLVRHLSARGENIPALLARLFGIKEGDLALRDGEMLIPMHPLQAEALLLDPEVKSLQAEGRLRHLGPAGPEFTATSSVRTVYSPECPWMLKFSLPVRITNSVRRNRRHELDAGIAMARLFDALDIETRFPRFRMILDPAAITLDLPGRAESGFEVILRENPFVAGRENGAITIAALTADPLPGGTSRLENIIRRLGAEHDLPMESVARRWFGDYLACALEPLIGLYDAHGIALEAHQQNSLLDVSRGFPSLYYYRDNQGFYLSNRYRDRLRRIIPEADTIASLYFDEAEIHDRFAYYLIVNQVFSIIARMGRDRLIAEEALLLMLRERLEALAASLAGAGRDFARLLLDRPTLGAKTNLTARLFDIDELQVEDSSTLYARFVNPLFRHAHVREGATRALAS